MNELRKSIQDLNEEFSEEAEILEKKQPEVIEIKIQ
jgi:hypothetical protein